LLFRGEVVDISSLLRLSALAGSGDMADDARLVESQAELEQVIEQLSEVDTFEPPPEFSKRARVSDPRVYETAARDPEGWWADRARELHWDRPFGTVLDDSEPPFYRWFPDGTLNASYNCLDRHVEAGHGDRVAYTGSPTTGGVRRARSGRSPTPTCTATCSAWPTA
jgi:hypothetical protein